MGEARAPKSKYREISGVARIAADVQLVILGTLGFVWALELPSRLGFAVFLEQYLALFLAFALSATFLCTRSGLPGEKEAVPWYDWVFATLGLAVGLYITAYFPLMSQDIGVITTERWALGAVAIALILESTRRLLGWTLVVLALVMLAYSQWAYLLPGLLYGRGSSPERVATYLYLDSNGIMGIALMVTATIVSVYILFGRLLQAIGGGTVFTDVALALMGRHRGGPAKVAVTSSSLFGTMSGSVVSNVVISGTISIPLMKRNGYRAPFAAATEAASSTGGQIMPPVMGVAAFIIAENLSMPYGQVALAALIPAILYYVSLFLQVDLEARKQGIRALPPAEIPTLGSVIRRGWPYFLPLAILVYTLLIAYWGAARAATAAVAVTVVIGLILRPQGFGAKAIVTALRDTGKTLLDVGVISALAGIIIGVLQLSGLGFTFSLILTGLADRSIIALLLVTAVVCIVLGMGMPTTVIYVMLAVMVAPALVQIGIEPIAAHLFIFYFGMLSMITPPVGMGTIAASAVGEADFWPTAIKGVRLAIVAYIVPFIFVFHPTLLLQDISLMLIPEVLGALLGVSLIAIASAGYLFGPISPLVRFLATSAGICLIAPATTLILHAVNLLGGILGVALIGWLYWRKRAELRRAGTLDEGVS